MYTCVYTCITHACDMLLVGEVKVVNLLLEGVQYLPMPGHVCGQDQSNNSLKKEEDRKEEKGRRRVEHGG